MSGFPDLVLKAQPALASVKVSATEGRTWLWKLIDVKDDTGSPIDLTTATGVCKVKDGNTTVATLTFTGGLGSFTIGLPKEDTAGLANGVRVRACRWFLRVSYGTDSVQFWGQQDSLFNIRREG